MKPFINLGSEILSRSVPTKVHINHGLHKTIQSDASRLLDPLNILSSAPRHSVDESWSWFTKRLENIGFESTGLLISKKNEINPMDIEDSKLYGNMVSKEYLDYARSNPQQMKDMRTFKNIQRARKPLTFMTDKDFKHHAPSEKKLAKSIHDMFGIKGWAFIPIHSGETNPIYTLG